MSKKKWRSGQDPWSAQEAKKYERPVASRKYLLEFLAKSGVPLSYKQIVSELGVEDADAREGLRRRLRAMEREGQVFCNRSAGYGLPEKMDLVRGQVLAHKDGFGFLRPEGGGEDLYLPSRQMRGLMHGDRALVRITGIGMRGRKEAALVEVLERGTQQLVGRFFIERGVAFITPDSRHLPRNVLVPPEEFGGAENGQIVAARILEPPSKHSQAIARVTEVLGDRMAPGMEVELAVRTHDLPWEWPQAALEEAAEFSLEVPEASKQGRVDLRDVPLVTIDGEDARDFDDAVYCEKKGRGWRLLVAIADVSAYVQERGFLDASAVERGTSVYFPGRVIPMLPEVLSNGLCSLNPKVDRLCMVCEMTVSAGGKVTRSRFFEGLMRSHARLTYTEVAAMVVAKKAGPRKHYAALVPHLEELHRLYTALHGARQQRGAIDFETTETRIVFDDAGKIDRIEPTERNDAHRMIEECMVAANVAAAEFLQRRRLPALYRVHEGPSLEKLTALREFLGELGLGLGGGESPEGHHYAALLQQVTGRDDAHLIQTVLLRSLSQAVYTPENSGHFGLGLECYAHFTSPIRRYPDLLVHRAIRHAVSGGKVAEFRAKAPDMVAMGEHCSSTERRADEATREATSWLKCEYMSDKVGEEYTGTVGGVTSFGLFIELDDIYVEGLVHVSSLGSDYFHFDAPHHRLSGERTGRTYRLADRLKVRVIRVSLDDRKIDFELVEDKPKAKSKSKSKGRSRRRRRR